MEIERRFLADTSDLDLSAYEKFDIVQSYIETEGLVTRIRIVGTSAFLTMKGPKKDGACDEFEYPIPFEDAVKLSEKYCSRVIKKTRYLIPNGPHTIELDVFHGHLEGLVIAEIELDDISEVVSIPKWFGSEITNDNTFSNYALSVKK